MKLNQDDKPNKELNQNLFMITAKQNCTDFNSLIDYLNNHQDEVESALINYGAVAIIGLWTKRKIVSVIFTLTNLEKYFSVSSEFNH